ncbi:hypothetical protein TgHK011_001333 [Trichoderma gracile]|nr:hypothetical protein TgHK011_001333 [Trichoderma gracile]
MCSISDRSMAALCERVLLRQTGPTELPACKFRGQMTRLLELWLAQTLSTDSAVGHPDASMLTSLRCRHGVLDLSRPLDIQLGGAVKAQ